MSRTMKIVGLDVGSTTVKAVVMESGAPRWQHYARHNTKQAEMVLDFLARIEAECGLVPGRDRIFITGSGAGLLAPLIGAKAVQEVVAVSAAVEKLHPDVNFVSEIGGEDMKTLFFTPSGDGKSKQVYMQSACSGGTGTFIEKTARKLQVSSEALAQAGYDGYNLHRISSKCGIFAESDSNTLIKSGVPVDEIVASLFEAVVYQNLATLTKGNTPMPGVLLLGGPNLFFRGLQEAWRHHLGKLWKERKIDADPARAIQVPKEAVYYACLGCIEIAATDPAAGIYAGHEALEAWIEKGQWEAKSKEGAKGLVGDPQELEGFIARYSVRGRQEHRACAEPVLVGCDFGSTTAKAVVLSPARELLFSCYALSNGNPIEDAKALFRQLRAAGFEKLGALALTGYGKDLLKDVIGSDLAIVETVAHATAALHYFPDADVICDVGGADVKIMILRQGTVADFRLNSQCSSGNGAFLQGVAERYSVPLEQYAEHAFNAKAVPALAMGCGVFLQSDIVNQQRKGWSADEIMAGLAAVLPLNVWVYAGQLQNLAAAGRKFILQGGTHRNLAVVKAQVDFIQAKVPDAEIVVHPYSGEAGAIGAALCAGDASVGASRFRGYEVIESLEYTSTTNEHTTCTWCPVSCKRTFIDVRLPGGQGRPWSKVPLGAGWERVISGNSCPKGLLEDANEMRIMKKNMESTRNAHPNTAELVRENAFRRVTPA
ncbi:MAG TPA: BadF/BadG/BcrA/BcrD ATPase family protein [Steroidobacteraceae bacterium]|nr:BadF/BadG/BcrA/BcrD ATPase family protein [Steroidobacteraceae bacterium]